MIPEPWAFALLALAAFRVWKLVAEDTLLDRPLARLREWEAVTCPWCSGAWIAGAWWASWYWLSPHWTLVAAVPFALSTTVAALALALDALAQAGE